MVLRYLYTILFYLAIPFIVIRLIIRGLYQPAYFRRWAERFGFYSVRFPESIWIHTVSVGETIAAVPLIKALLSAYPHVQMVVTTMTPTGAATVKNFFGAEVKHLYLPYDLPHAIHRFLNAIKPRVAIVMETEMWPNFIAACDQYQIPFCLINARLSEHSAKGYQRIDSMTSKMLQAIKVIAAQTLTDANRFIALGAAQERIVVTGNIKFDLNIPKDLVIKANDLRKNLGKNRPIWIAASTHEGEEEIIFSAHQLILKEFPNAILILSPRHPHRFAAVAKRGTSLFTMKRRSHGKHDLSECVLYFADTMGELLLFYAVSDVAFVGGSLVPIGGHNLLEPAALGKPILAGPYQFNFTEISEQLEKVDALHIVKDEFMLASEVIYFFKHCDEALMMGKRAQEVVIANRGALQKQLKVIQEILEKTDRR